MKTFKHIFVITLLTIGFCYSASAQTPKKTNVKKELKKLLKNLPADKQLQVLEITQKIHKRHLAEIAKPTQDAVANAVKSNAVKGNAVKGNAKVNDHAGHNHDNHKGHDHANKPQQINLPPADESYVDTKKTTANQPAKPSYVQKAEGMERTQVEWFEEVHDFGAIKQGAKPEHTFKFKNTGKHPLQLTRVKPSCGCTTPSFSKEPIPPGGEGYVKVVFNSAGKMGAQNKAVTIWHNGTPITKVLRFKGNISK